MDLDTSYKLSAANGLVGQQRSKSNIEKDLSTCQVVHPHTPTGFLAALKCL